MQKILVAEDEKTVKDSIYDILTSAGYDVVSAENGLDAYHLAQGQKPDLIISDIMMPKLDGYGLYEKVQNDPDLTLIPFIFLTAKAEVSDIRMGMNLGADDYITKPFRAKDLITAVNVRLDKNKKFAEKIENIKESISLYVPHELRTPLVSMLGYSGMILDEKDSLNGKEVIDMVNRIKHSALRLNNTIEKFILFSELEGIEKKEELEGIDKDYVNSAKAQLNLIAEEYLSSKNRKHDLEIEIEDSQIPLPEMLLKKLVINLLENAVKFSNASSKIEVTGKVEDELYHLNVLDHGIGMSEEEISNIDAFMQFNRKKYQQRGNGLGLAIVKKILNLYCGKLKIESEKDSYTSVHVYLPLKK